MKLISSKKILEMRASHLVVPVEWIRNYLTTNMNLNNTYKFRSQKYFLIHLGQLPTNVDLFLLQ